jgi:hypothetical protein
MTHLTVLIIGLLSGYLVGSAGVRYQRNSDLQAMIDIEATTRRADGIHRKGDLLTEYEPAESSAGCAREISR